MNPAYIWPLTTIKNGQVPTTPPLKTHGNIIVSNDGLIFEDESAYLNAGDFQGITVVHLKLQPSNLDSDFDSTRKLLRSDFNNFV